MAVISCLRIISMLLAIVGTTFLLPIGVAFAVDETFVIPSFFIPMAVSWIFAAVIFFLFRKKQVQLNTRSTFLIVALAWISASFIGAVPLYLAVNGLDFTDAFFESVSGFTTTGATIFSDVESLPRSINLWRCETHWLGGMGIVALTVALLPILGVGGFQLIKAETTGPEKGKVTPKIATTAKALWIIYMVLTAIQTVLLMLSGMDFIDALSYSFATLGTGGFATKNTSVGAYNSVSIDVICTVFMFLAGINFSMYYYLITGKLEDIKNNSELKLYVVFFITAVLALTVCILPEYGSFARALRYSSFQTASIMTTTGFATADYTTWNSAAQFILFLLFFIGGCSGSTAGGVKVIRWVVLGKQVHNETERMLHPHGVFSIRLNGSVGRKDIVFNVAAFIAVYAVMIFITTAVGCIGNLDLLSSFTGAISMVGNVGPAFGKLGPSCNYGFLCDGIKWWYCFAMLAGRLELYTMIIFFMHEFWEK